MGSSNAETSRRFLSSIGTDAKLTSHLKCSIEYELIDSSGQNASDESLSDISLFYAEGRMDLSLRWQERIVVGDNDTNKTMLTANLKYRFSSRSILSFRLLNIDYSDLNKSTPFNSYRSTLLEGIWTTKF